MIYTQTENINFVTIHLAEFIKREFDIDIENNTRLTSSGDLIGRMQDMKAKRFIVLALKKFPKAIKKEHYMLLWDEGELRKRARVTMNVIEIYKLGIPCQKYLKDCRIQNRLISKSFYNSLHDLVDEADIDRIDANRLKNYLGAIQYEEMTTNENRHFTITSTSNGNLSYLPAGKVTHVNSNGEWLKTNRQEIKAGKGIAKIFSHINIKPTVIEKLSNAIKAKYNFTGEIKIVKGDDIKFYYSGNRIGKGRHSTLSNSCMRHESCQEYFGIYTDNPDKVSMAVAFDPSGGVIGRAIIWNAINDKTGEKVIFMDRAYGNDLTITALTNFGKEMGAWVKYRQTYSCDRAISTIGEVEHIEFSVTLKNSENKRWPYLDTMYYTNDDELNDNIITITSYDGDCQLTSTEGYAEGRQEDDENYVTTACGDWVHQDECVWVCHLDEYIYETESVYSDSYGEYIRESDAVYVDNDYFLDTDDDIIQCVSGQSHHKDNCTWNRLYDEWFYEDEETVECYINGEVLPDDIITITIDEEEYMVHNSVTEDEIITKLNTESLNV